MSTEFADAGILRHHAAVSSAAATLVRDRLHALLAAIDPRRVPVAMPAADFRTYFKLAC